MTELLMFVSPTCAPCRALKPRVQSLADQLQLPLQLIDVTSDAHAGLVAAHRVRMVPTVVLQREGAVVLTATAATFDPGVFEDAVRALA